MESAPALKTRSCYLMADALRTTPNWCESRRRCSHRKQPRQTRETKANLVARPLARLRRAASADSYKDAAPKGAATKAESHFRCRRSLGSTTEMLPSPAFAVRRWIAND